MARVLHLPRTKHVILGLRCGLDAMFIAVWEVAIMDGLHQYGIYYRLEFDLRPKPVGSLPPDLVFGVLERPTVAKD